MLRTGSQKKREALVVDDDAPRAAPVVPGSVSARILRDVWAGEDVVVDSPPGAGKTYLIVNSVAHLVARSNVMVHILCPTKAQAAAILHRLVRVMDRKLVVNGVASIPKADLPIGLGKSGRVCVRTLASAAYTPPTGGLVIVDEAYQAKYVDVNAATVAADQVWLVGDPGQIGPVVTVGTGPWESMRTPPHRPAPAVVSKFDGIQCHSLPSTYRLGRLSAEIIAPLYRFEFDSVRGDAHIELDGEVLPEVSKVNLRDDAAEHERIQVCVSRAESLLRSRTESGEHASVAVVLSRNTQVSIAMAMLAGRGVTVGTADRLQGGEWDAVVALDPLMGGAYSQHTASPGRLCVMLSRHSRHLTWVQDQTWREGTEGFGSSRREHIAVRSRIQNRADQADGAHSL